MHALFNETNSEKFVKIYIWLQPADDTSHVNFPFSKNEISNQLALP
jgi:hypothetical protein